MKGNDLLRAIGAAEDADLILAESASKKKAWGGYRYIWAAAAAAVLVLALAVVPKLIKKPNDDHHAFVPTEDPTQGAQLPAQHTTEAALSAEPGSEHPTQPAVTIAPTEYVTDGPTSLPTDDPTDAPTAPPTARPTDVPTERPTAAPTERPTERPTAVPTERPTERPTAAPTQRPTERPTAQPTEKPTPGPTPVPTETPTEDPTPTPTVAVATDAPLFDEFSSEEELVERIRMGGGVYDSIRYFYAPKRAPEGAALSGIVVSNVGISFSYSSQDGSLHYEFMWLWNTDPDEYIERFIRSGVQYEKLGRYYTYYADQLSSQPSVLWKQDGAMLFASVPPDPTLEELEYFCDARLVRID